MSFPIPGPIGGPPGIDPDLLSSDIDTPEGNISGRVGRTGFDAVDAILAAFPWLNQLEGIYDFIVGLVINDTPPEVVASQVRQTEQYKARFPGMSERVGKGYAPITESEYLQLEDSYRGLLREFGVLGYFGSTELDMREFASQQIGSDVSPAEMSRRLDAGFAQVVDSGAAVQEAFEQFYGFKPTEELLLLHALDPDRGIREIENQLQTVLIGGEALRYGLNITRIRSEMLASSGISREMARSGFADVAREQPQLQTLARLHNTAPLSQVDLENFFFHEDPEVQQKRFRVFETALNEFGGAAPAATTQQGGLLELVDRDRSV